MNIEFLPLVEELNIYVEKIIDDHKFELWRFIRANVGVGYENLIGFFRYFGLEMEEFIHNNVGQVLLSYLKENASSIRIFMSPSQDYFETIKFTCNYTKIYFYSMSGSSYNCLELEHFWNRCLLLNIRLPKITKIERMLDGKWTPVLMVKNDVVHRIPKVS